MSGLASQHVRNLSACQSMRYHGLLCAQARRVRLQCDLIGAGSGREGVGSEGREGDCRGETIEVKEMLENLLSYGGGQDLR